MMRPFACGNCHALVYFEDTICLSCGEDVVFDRDRVRMTTAGQRCTNRAALGCNWRSPSGGLCSSCRLTRIRPADTDQAGLAAWAATEAAKRQVIVELDRLPVGLPRSTDDGRRLAFELLSQQGHGHVLTGHADGVITINMAEAFDPHREAVRVELGEPARSLLGHIRHEIGHWYWETLSETGRLDGFRDVFGDERVDYQGALAEHYAHADDGGWRTSHISRYAAAHPWEDWAETFAHYLHIHAALDTARAWGVATTGPRPEFGIAHTGAPAVTDTEAPSSFADVIARWLAVEYALNAVTRSVGNATFYPYTLTTTVIAKLRYIDHAISSPAAVQA